MFEEYAHAAHNESRRHLTQFLPFVLFFYVCNAAPPAVFFKLKTSQICVSIKWKLVRQLQVTAEEYILTFGID